jgi:hypothetical protein
MFYKNFFKGFPSDFLEVFMDFLEVFHIQD